MGSPQFPCRPLSSRPSTSAISHPGTCGVDVEDLSPNSDWGKSGILRDSFEPDTRTSSQRLLAKESRSFRSLRHRNTQVVPTRNYEVSPSLSPADQHTRRSSVVMLRGPSRAWEPEAEPREAQQARAGEGIQSPLASSPCSASSSIQLLTAQSMQERSKDMESKDLQDACICPALRVIDRTHAELDVLSAALTSSQGTTPSSTQPAIRAIQALAAPEQQDITGCQCDPDADIAASLLCPRIDGMPSLHPVHLDAEITASLLCPRMDGMPSLHPVHLDAEIIAECSPGLNVAPDRRVCSRTGAMTNLDASTTSSAEDPKQEFVVETMSAMNNGVETVEDGMAGAVRVQERSDLDTRGLYRTDRPPTPHPKRPASAASSSQESKDRGGDSRARLDSFLSLASLGERNRPGGVRSCTKKTGESTSRTILNPLAASWLEIDSIPQGASQGALGSRLSASSHTITFGVRRRSSGGSLSRRSSFWKALMSGRSCEVEESRHGTAAHLNQVRELRPGVPSILHNKRLVSHLFTALGSAVGGVFCGLDSKEMSTNQ
ncbi:hypothetical protein CEUSTIGMA_g163.t1 [Chlamydomonas eustigma]|uniref:Uncharacterized protein n=1 Tax=Chlamydomonas eustigma TaxID=1157962 RepID=A0A250WPD9_9CHLO|nr:hypothetical protein CEUSTIGMA_g163.t1 [Chlamydomonas eustigma]|eukprot:GAX72707.1 hypothetical protein CEUSTIGMA_g163.t1 [Chlamydomonas eustigma]